MGLSPISIGSGISPEAQHPTKSVHANKNKIFFILKFEGFQHIAPSPTYKVDSL